MEQPNDDRLRQLLLLLEWTLCLRRALLRNRNGSGKRELDADAYRRAKRGEKRMGDIIKLKKITLMYGHLYQIDYCKKAEEELKGERKK